MKLKLAFGAFALAAPSLFFGLCSTNPVWQSFFAGLSSSLVVLGVGILSINLYLESASKRDVAKALSYLSLTPICHYLNAWVSRCKAVFGRDAYAKIWKELIAAKQDVNALQKDVRKKIYEIYANSTDIRERIFDLETTLAELTRIIGWDLDPKLLTSILVARTEIIRLKSVVLDGSDRSIDRVTKYLFYIYANTDLIRKTLLKIADVQESDDRA